MIARYLILVSALISLGLAADESARITSLPGLSSQPKFRQYSGYLNASKTNRLHYWFVESQSNPSSDPFLLWLTGGPGCSSISALLTENGPFTSQPNSKLTVNPYSWNRHANVLYLESPVGVGFSVALDGNTTTDDDKTSLENFNSLKDFFSKFPEFKSNDFYITGESYAGVYIPTLTVRVLGDKSFNLKGIAVGNGLSNYRYNDASVLYFYYYHGLFGEKLWNRLLTRCNCTGKDRCFFGDSASLSCKLAIDEASQAINGLNPYNLYGPCYHTATNKMPNVLEIPHLFRSNPYIKKSRQLMHSFRSKLRDTRMYSDPPCINGSATTNYLNMPSVRTALHIPSSVQPWTLCSDAIQYHRTYSDMSPQYQVIIKSGIRVLIYNGDVDTVCNFLGEEWFFDDMNYPLDYSNRQWYAGLNEGKNKQFGGVSKSWLKGQLVFTTVLGAGHMVPTFRPHPAFHMINHFVTNRPL